MHLAGPYVGYTIAFLPDPLRTAEALLQVRPTVLPSVPRVYEKVHAAVLAKFDEETGVKRRIVDWALSVGAQGERAAPARRADARGPRAAAPAGATGSSTRRCSERLGGRLRIAISGGAPLAKEIAEFFDALGITILEGYGLTECTSAATVNRVDAVPPRHGRPGAAGNRASPRRGRRAVHPEPDGLRRLSQGRGRDARGPRRRRLAQLGRHRRDRRRRLRHDHRSQEGHPRHGRRQERRAGEHRERPEGAPRDLAGARDRRPPAVRRRARHARSRRDRRRSTTSRSTRACRRSSTT